MIDAAIAMPPTGYARLFSAPLTACFIAALMVAIGAYLFYRAGKRKAPAAARLYWSRLGLVAEVCVAAGLIGLAVFAGGAKIGADHQLLEQRAALSQANVDERVRLVLLRNCAPAERRGAAPYSPAVATNDLCATVRALAAGSAQAVDWEAAELSLRDFGARYPGCISNVFTRHSDCEELVATATRLAGDIGAAQADQRAARSDEAMTMLFEASSGWSLLLLAMLVAAFGVAIKCARAAAQLFAPAQSSGQSGGQ
ncbi:MAG: hypothetical protein QFF03_15675 [Pseudomonadota bacterium]|nr:hypothetical protein [Pseudomonadota bacterium]